MACLVQIEPISSFAKTFPNYTSFKSAGSVRELDAQQVLRACHVGGMFDARLEINIYRLLHELGHKAGPWIGAPIKLSEQNAAVDAVANSVLPPMVSFENCDLADGPQFLAVKEGIFEERTNVGIVLSEVPFEYVVPRKLSLSTATAIPVIRTSRGPFVGLELRDLPA